jgi:predicted ABC-type ATPase
MASPQCAHIVILAGPNGAGKSTAAPRVLRGALAVDHFVNADVIARGLSGFDPDSAALAAGRIMLDRLDALAAAHLNFAFETTLASRTFAPWIRERILEDYSVHLYFITLASSELAVQRVADRVRRGGHDVPPDTIRRRFRRAHDNLFRLYIPIVTTWLALDNSAPIAPQEIAFGGAGIETTINNPIRWSELQEQARGA